MITCLCERYRSPSKGKNDSEEAYISFRNATEKNQFSKPKYMLLSKRGTDAGNSIRVGDEEFVRVQSFKYLVSSINQTNDVSQEKNARIV